MTSVDHLRRSTPVRVSISRDIGGEIDGAWWPRIDRITSELPHLVQVLSKLLGDITAINVNWPALERPPDINWSGWEHKRQHVITIEGQLAAVRLLVVPYATHGALALMVLRRAAGLDISASDQAKRYFESAVSIVRLAQQQQLYGYPLPPEKHPVSTGKRPSR